MNNVIEFSGFKSRPPRANPTLLKVSPVPVESLFGTLSAALRKLRYDLFSEPCAPEHRWFWSPRRHRQQFCKLVREFKGVSLETLCARLNEHPEILKLERLPSFTRFYPITPEFILDLENNINKIIEYNPYGGGFLGIGAYGTPTPEIAKAFAEICGAKREYEKFEQWCYDYQYAQAKECRQ